MMINMDEQLTSLIKELCQKEVDRTGLPLVYAPEETSESDIYNEKTLYIHQKMELGVKGFDSVILENQNDIKFKNGKWEPGHSYDKFYGYSLAVKQNGYEVEILVNEDFLPTEDEIVERLTSKEFKELFNKHKKMKDKILGLCEKLDKITEELALFVEN